MQSLQETKTISQLLKKTKKQKQKKEKNDKIVSLGKSKLHAIKVLISKALLNSYISHDEFGNLTI